MFYGSNSHPESAAAIFTLVASCRLHGIDPEQYVDEVMRALPDWPKDRYLELSPKSVKSFSGVGPSLRLGGAEHLDAQSSHRVTERATTPINGGANVAR
jgi:hypothetical protein